MRLRRFGLAAAIIATLGFSCYNEPDYPTPGMSNPPGGSGAAPAPVSSVGPAAGLVAAVAVAGPARLDSGRATA